MIFRTELFRPRGMPLIRYTQKMKLTLNNLEITPQLGLFQRALPCHLYTVRQTTLKIQREEYNISHDRVFPRFARHIILASLVF